MYTVASKLLFIKIRKEKTIDLHFVFLFFLKVPLFTFRIYENTKSKNYQFTFCFSILLKSSTLVT